MAAEESGMDIAVSSLDSQFSRMSMSTSMGIDPRSTKVGHKNLVIVPSSLAPRLGSIEGGPWIRVY